MDARSRRRAGGESPGRDPAALLGVLPLPPRAAAVRGTDRLGAAALADADRDDAARVRLPLAVLGMARRRVGPEPADAADRRRARVRRADRRRPAAGAVAHHPTLASLAPRGGVPGLLQPAPARRRHPSRRTSPSRRD